jgi:formylglycine-generating enzyme
MNTGEDEFCLNLAASKAKFLRSASSAVLILFVAWASRPALALITPDVVTVTSQGNRADFTGLGSVSYEYQIGKFEVLNSQYASFLNAVAKVDPYGLYAPQMSGAAFGGINRSGVSGTYTYSVKPGFANYPALYMSYYDAARFVNWLHNGQPTGGLDASTTEGGVYTFTGATTAGTRNPGARFALPTKDEWYKAAFFEPTGAGDYWLYPTRSDVLPTSRPPNASDANSANFYYDDGIANGVNGGFALTGSTNYVSSFNYLTLAGAYSLANGPWGTFDQGGNVREWLELGTDGTGHFAGDAWVQTSEYELSAPGSINSIFASFESGSIGFRIVAVPEPAMCWLFGLGACSVWIVRRMPNSPSR